MRVLSEAAELECPACRQPLVPSPYYMLVDPRRRNPPWVCLACIEKRRRELAPLVRHRIKRHARVTRQIERGCGKVTATAQS